VLWNRNNLLLFLLRKSFGSSSSSGSDSGSSSGSILTYLAQFFNKKTFVPNFAFSMLEGRSSIVPRKLASNYTFSLLLNCIYVESGSKSSSGAGIGTEMHCGSGSAKTKSCGFCGSSSDSTTLHIAAPHTVPAANM
jgi:hypothetical protein